MIAMVRALRPKQWTKNAVLYAGFLFTLNEKWRLLSPEMLAYFLRSSLAVVLFCALSSGIYLINDLKDIEQDRQHPVKRLRPLAAGTLSPTLAKVMAAVLLVGSVAGSAALQPAFGAVALFYVLMQIGYTFWFKHMVLLDVFTIAVGFVLRAVGGAVAIRVAISPWLYIVTLLGALFLGFCKRRHELLLLSGDAKHHRRILQEYSTQLLEQMISILAAATIMAYSLYTFTSPNLPKNHLMMLTIPLVIYGMFRYLYLVHQREGGGSPEELLLRDRPLLITILLWIGTAAVVLAFYR